MTEPRTFPQIVEAVNPALVRVVLIQRPDPKRINVTAQIGTGFILTEDGYIATAGHNLTAAAQRQQIAVILPTSQVIPCRLVASNIQWKMDEKAHMTADLGVLKTEAKHGPLPWVRIGVPPIARQGDEVGVIGYQSFEDPRSLGVANLPPQEAQEFLRASQAQTFAARATVASRFEVSHGDRESTILYLDSHLSVGMSGAPVVWLESGEVIGVVSGSKIEAQMSGFAQVLLPAGMTKVFGVQLLQECVAGLQRQEKDQQRGGESE
jgi:S1-C subfamily serine protease